METNPNIPPNHGQPPAPTVNPPQNYTDGFGIASIIMAAFFFTIPGLILGLVGESKAKSNKASPILSRIGWIANLAMLIISILVSILIFAFVVQHADEFKTSFDSEYNSSSEDARQTFSGGNFSVKAPNSFSDTSLDYPDANISIGDDTNEIYLLAYADSAIDIADETTIIQYADQAFQSFQEDADFTGQTREQLAKGTVPNPDNLDVIDYRMEANYGISKFIYYDRYIKTATGYYMLTTWTIPGKFTDNVAVMKNTLASFKESTSTKQ